MSRKGQHTKLCSAKQTQPRLAVALPLLALAAIGCGDDVDSADGSKESDSGSESGSGSGGSGGSGSSTDAGADASKHDAGMDSGTDAAASGIYGYVRETFVNLAKSSALPDDAPELDPKKAREFMSDPWFVGGAAVDQNGAQLRQLKVSDELKWSDGPKLDFSQYPLGENGVSPFFSWSVDDHHMYFNYDLTSRIVWDPTDFKILANKEDSNIPLKLDGLPLEAAGNRGIMKAGNQPVQMAYFWKDEDWWKFASKSTIALYDRDTHEESKLIEIECPGLAVGTRDEQGYTYWSTWDYKGIASLYEQGPKPCLARITPDGELDEAFTTDLLDWTGGKFGKNFMYVRDGWGLYMVFDHEKTGLDFTKPPATEGGIETNPIDYWWNPTYWRLYKVDLKAQTAKLFAPTEDLLIMEYGVEHVDGRVFLNLWYAEKWDSKKTAGEQWDEATKGRVDELLPDDTSKTFSTQGDGRGRWVRIR